MPLVTTAEMVGAAHRDGVGITAYNVITLEHAEAIVAAAHRIDKPIILQVSENAVLFHRGQVDASKLDYYANVAAPAPPPSGPVTEGSWKPSSAKSSAKTARTRLGCARILWCLR